MIARVRAVDPVTVKASAAMVAGYVFFLAALLAREPVTAAVVLVAKCGLVALCGAPVVYAAGVWLGRVALPMCGHVGDEADWMIETNKEQAR